MNILLRLHAKTITATKTTAATRKNMLTMLITRRWYASGNHRHTHTHKRTFKMKAKNSSKRTPPCIKNTTTITTILPNSENSKRNIIRSTMIPNGSISTRPQLTILDVINIFERLEFCGKTKMKKIMKKSEDE